MSSLCPLTQKYILMKKADFFCTKIIYNILLYITLKNSLSSNKIFIKRASLVAQMVKCLPAMPETWVQFLDWEDPLEKEMALHSSTLAWQIPWMEEPDRLQSMGLQRVGYDWATSLSLSWNLHNNSTQTTKNCGPGNKKGSWKNPQDNADWEI